ncbi:type II toxin-antitoxin system PemK/MazF family toxin [Brachybacterium saurashtrense]|uniref:Type II toxin-antitoxin system PemK/MazF family toxin n=1 Tax=Brachybacterium saurashtrense TaxID=556288 RepID=A0A345YMS8_9MICO|nr:type II toxin-antitoxin system PemK/MazF family toxin [Brachybacterium saurashtrense]AXK45230.1 type II toxin-antitoxin system PemK/MazF family toxin [Brachybacterium saurashtrense]RRR22016.1 type II toxin-antitoxin system PemK/MazF family toxin [Brachybacterium saurashtrense]
MSLVDRFTSALRSAARSPAVRRSARGLGRAALRSLREQRRAPSDGRAVAHPGRSGNADAPAEDSPALADRRRGGALALEYTPHADGRPDPGEVVWAWVPYEEDITQGKDRPVLVIAEEAAASGGSDGTGEVLIALMLTSRDRAASGGTTTDEHGATWVDIGAGDWDSRGRPSEVRADRLLRLVPAAVRREGGRLDRTRYDRVATAVRDVHGW